MMKFSYYSPLNILLLGCLFTGLVLLNNQLFQGARLDLTQDSVYSLSDGSIELIQQLDEPVYWYLFFSDKTSEGMTGLRNYANRVESLLQEYVNQSDGNIKLQIIDPEPFSVEEDLADQFGLTAAGIGASGDTVYFGLGARNALDNELQIPFFDPGQERFLEYEISKLLYQLSEDRIVNVTLLTDLPIEGGQDPMTGQSAPAWTIYTQLLSLYQVDKISSDASVLPAETDVLIILHPKQLSTELTWAIDQYAMKGGRLMLLLDPHNESDMSMAMGGMPPSVNSSDISDLLSGWGIQYDASKVVLDEKLGLEIRDASGQIVRHPGILGLGADNLSQTDVLTSGLEVINGASFGALSLSMESEADWLPLLTTSQNSVLVEGNQYVSQTDLQQFHQLMTENTGPYTLAARLSGRVPSAFSGSKENKRPESIEQTESFLPSTEKMQLLIVADTDWLQDRFWVQTANFFGQPMITPFADNGDLITNGVENLSGSNGLISIRSRGTFSRPFEKVEQITLEAEKKFRDHEQRLQQQLEETEAQLMAMQQQGEENTLVISTEQQQAIDDFLQQKISIRQQLREVRHQMDKDIETLGSWLRFINIVLMPMVLVLLLALIKRISIFRSNTVLWREKE